MSIFVLIGEKVSVWLLVVWLQGTATGLQMEDCCRSTLCVLCPTLHSSHTLRGHLLAVVSSWDISITISGENTSNEITCQYKPRPLASGWINPSITSCCFCCHSIAATPLRFWRPIPQIETLGPPDSTYDLAVINKCLF